MKNRSIYFLRHSDATPGTDGVDDVYRHLTLEGSQKARRLRAWFDGKKFGKVFCSPANRAMETAQAVTGSMIESHFNILETLYTLKGQEEKLETMFLHLREAPLRQYHFNPYGHHLNEQGLQSARAIRWEITRGFQGDMLVVAHHATLQATAQHLLPQSAVCQFVLKTVLPPCGLMKISIGDADQNVTAEVVNWK